MAENAASTSWINGSLLQDSSAVQNQVFSEAGCGFSGFSRYKDVTSGEQQPIISVEASSADTRDEIAAGTAKKKRIPLASIPTTISIGLLIAMMYLGARIFTAHRTPKPAAVISSTPVSIQPPVPIAAPAIAAPSAIAPPVIAPKAIVKAEPSKEVAVAPSEASDEVPTITPQPGQRFIQVGALDLDAKDTHKFVQRLRGKNFDPHVAPGPSPVLSRVLIGPFDNLDALNEKKAQLETEGIVTFVRKY
ncbi:MAG TPA: SPOR domain-containing protein [Bryobacteraceae bacterium]|nr:SPOR domain-containing protein [Bryobacteraceae bacterium]